MANSIFTIINDKERSTGIRFLNTLFALSAGFTSSKTNDAKKDPNDWIRSTKLAEHLVAQLKNNPPHDVEIDRYLMLLKYAIEHRDDCQELERWNRASVVIKLFCEFSDYHDALIQFNSLIEKYEDIAECIKDLKSQDSPAPLNPKFLSDQAAKIMHQCELLRRKRQEFQSAQGSLREAIYNLLAEGYTSSEMRYDPDFVPTRAFGIDLSDLTSESPVPQAAWMSQELNIPLIVPSLQPLIDTIHQNTRNINQVKLESGDLDATLMLWRAIIEANYHLSAKTMETDECSEAKSAEAEVPEQTDTAKTGATETLESAETTRSAEATQSASEN